MTTAEKVSASANEQFLAMLLGKDILVKEVDPIDIESGGPFVITVFRDDDGNSHALWICELGLAASFGAALSMMPRGTADECAKRGEISDVLLANYNEVANIGSSLFNKTGKHVVLETTLVAPPFPENVTAILAAVDARSDHSVEVDGFDPGKMVWVCR